MDPEEEVLPSNNASTLFSHRSTQSVDCSGHTSPLPVIFHVSPAHDRERFGYIHLTPRERVHQETIQAYLINAGRAVITLTCPDFDEFLLANSLRTCNVSFLCNLPE
jgi:hypothetical protein